MWDTLENREAGDPKNWQRCNHLYGMNTLLNYLTDLRKVLRSIMARGFYEKLTELLQEYLYRVLGGAKFCELYADYAAHNVGGFEFLPSGTEARAVRELKHCGEALDVHPIVQTFTKQGTGGKWYRPSHDFVTRGWSYNRYRVLNSLEGAYSFQLKGDAQGSEGEVAEFRARLVVKDGKSVGVIP
jgi:hypothetical protein